MTSNFAQYVCICPVRRCYSWGQCLQYCSGAHVCCPMSTLPPLHCKVRRLPVPALPDCHFTGSLTLYHCNDQQTSLCPFCFPALGEGALQLLQISLLLCTCTSIEQQVWTLEPEYPRWPQSIGLNVLVIHLILYHRAIWYSISKIVYCVYSWKLKILTWFSV